jgi:DNA/RNA-binding domain of Phe-tRNA-synthetase-like protein
MTVTVAPEARTIAVPVAVRVDDLVVAPRGPELDEALRAAEARLREPDTARDAAAGRTRAMYRRFGVDPTRTRPSSEALWRRVKKGDRLPMVNNLVDVVNWCSVESQVPFGLYDTATIGGILTLRLGREGEAYEGIRKDRVNLAGRLVLSDERGPFGNPTSDSARSMVTDATRSVLVVLYTPTDMPRADADALSALTRDRLRAYGRPAQNPK